MGNKDVLFARIGDLWRQGCVGTNGASIVREICENTSGDGSGVPTLPPTLVIPLWSKSTPHIQLCSGLGVGILKRKEILVAQCNLYRIDNW